LGEPFARFRISIGLWEKRRIQKQSFSSLKTRRLSVWALPEDAKFFSKPYSEQAVFEPITSLLGDPFG
jgi:hypothetical protein